MRKDGGRSTRAGGRAGPPRARPAESSRRAVPARGPRSIGDEIRATARPGQGERAQRAFDKAVELLERDRAAAAVAPAMEAKDAAPRSGAVRELVGIALYRAGRFRDALRELQAYRRMTGRLDQNHLIADAHRALGAPQRAVEEARATLRASVPVEVRAEAIIVGASALADLGRFDEAIGLIRTHAERDRVARPADLRVWYAAGDILERAGRRREAVAEFRRVLRHDAGAFDTAERLARLEASR